MCPSNHTEKHADKASKDIQPEVADPDTAAKTALFASLQSQRSQWNRSEPAFPMPSEADVRRAATHAASLRLLDPEFIDGAFEMRCAEIPAVFARGVTKDEARDALSERLTERLALILAAGGEMPKPGKPPAERVKKSFDMPAELETAVNTARAPLGMTFGDAAVAGLRLWLSQLVKPAR